MRDLSLKEIEKFSNKILEDYDNKIPSSIFKEKKRITNEEALLVQSNVAKLRQKRGEEVIGYKIGCISKDTQKKMGFNPPEKNKTLHWKYGVKIESKKKKKIFSSHHFIIHKNAFKKIKFNEEIIDYGHEDTIFWIDLKKENYTFEFIENPLTHIGLETNEQYIKKTKSALKNIYLLNKKYDLKNTSIIKTHIILSKFYLNYIVLLVFNLTEKNILKNLLSGKPSLILFQMYKMGYFFRLTKDH